MTIRKSVNITRTYRPTPDACARALVALLESRANKKSVESTPELDTRNTRGESSDGSRAKPIIQS
jgi:hypothetical protein